MGKQAMSERRKIRVMLAEDQNLVRLGICSLLELSESIEVVGQVDDGSQVVEGIRRYLPDVLLIDIRMPKMTGIDALRAMRDADCMVPTIILTTFDDSQLVLEGMQAGAKGYLLKDVSLNSLVDAIESVYAGRTLVQPAITERILKGLATMEPRFDNLVAPEALSEKEIEVLRLMAGGFSNREISRTIHKSEGTVKNQVSSILEKLGVRDRTQAVLRAINLGLL
jgi:DNA-binding NarL/FixJ family response regulator